MPTTRPTTPAARPGPTCARRAEFPGVAHCFRLRSACLCFPPPRPAPGDAAPGSRDRARPRPRAPGHCGRRRRRRWVGRSTAARWAGVASRACPATSCPAR
ncbi:hypothetical protein G6F61_014627 [Rhizopus arrhizus]|nr:hypothetical protein G6F61_014627 [Rhizopus arrhizus]